MVIFISLVGIHELTVTDLRHAAGSIVHHVCQAGQTCDLQTVVQDPIELESRNEENIAETGDNCFLVFISYTVDNTLILVIYKPYCCCTKHSFYQKLSAVNMTIVSTYHVNIGCQKEKVLCLTAKTTLNTKNDFLRIELNFIFTAISVGVSRVTRSLIVTPPSLAAWSQAMAG